MVYRIVLFLASILFVISSYSQSFTHLTIEELEEKKEEAIMNEDFKLAKRIKEEISRKQYIASQPKPTPAVKKPLKPIDNRREKIYQKMDKMDFSSSNTESAGTVNQITNVPIHNDPGKIKSLTENEIAQSLKYRRNSIYTLMINDTTIPFFDIIRDAFGDYTLSSKFNEHNIGPYMINGEANSDDQTAAITRYLKENDVAKHLVAKWFNRNEKGEFNMNLIAERGMYDATTLDKVIASSTERGNAMLADAGEELIGKTFIIINDYKFTSKEEVVQNAKKTSYWVKVLANAAGADLLADGISVLEMGAEIAGKGYWVRTTSYLYRLVWDEETAATFYQYHWTDKSNLDPLKIEKFNTANNYKLKLIGFQTAGADIQSSIFTDKSDEELIRMAAEKATTRAMAKLEKKYEEFRTKTPLYSSEPLAAKIGTKEGVEIGDKFEVLQQELDNEGKTTYKRKGIITVDELWDNSYTEEEMSQLEKEGKLPTKQYTTFKGAGNYYPGQLIKQIN